MTRLSRVSPLLLGVLAVGLTGFPAAVRAADAAAGADEAAAERAARTSALLERLSSGLTDALQGTSAARAVTVPRVAAVETAQTRLELTDAQKKAVEDIVNPSVEVLEARLKSALGDKYRGLQRLTAGLQLIQAGPAAVIHEPTATVLNLSTSQRERIQVIANEYNAALAELLPFGAGRTDLAAGLRGFNVGDLQEKRYALQEASNELVAELLTQSQKTEIKKLMDEASGIRLPTNGLDAASILSPTGGTRRGQ